MDAVITGYPDIEPPPGLDMMMSQFVAELARAAVRQEKRRAGDANPQVGSGAQRKAQALTRADALD